MIVARLKPNELREFLFGKTLNCYDPESRVHIATAHYGQDGVCRMTFSDGTEDTGVFGLTDDIYWTQYKRFRSGTLNKFYLESVAPQIAQAFHTDGRRAFLQTPLPTLENETLESR
ncbi:hypothetical protein [Thalassobaculum salexigens]|uniref:hypothetical protein n=1 Tax=Thalassobaculum salexigens TaxID=455360 RepID=UPI00248EF463|nr:hypothetical protein [Thalassobaculum salexigens]